MRAQSRAERRRRKWEVCVLSARAHTRMIPPPRYYRRDTHCMGRFSTPIPDTIGGTNFAPRYYLGGEISLPQYYRGDKFRPPILSVILSEDPRKNPTLRG